MLRFRLILGFPRNTAKSRERKNMRNWPLREIPRKPAKARELIFNTFVTFSSSGWPLRQILSVQLGQKVNEWQI